MSTQLVVEVRQEHWDRGKRAVEAHESPFRSRICAVAQAIRNVVPYGTHVSVSPQSVEVGDSTYYDGIELRELVDAFDDDLPMPILPLTLTLTTKGPRYGK